MENLKVFNLNDRATGDSITLEWEVETDAPEETLSFETVIFGKVKVPDENGVEQEEEMLFVQAAETPRAHTFTNINGFPLLPETEYCLYVQVYEEPGHVFLNEFPDDGIGHIAKTLNVDKKAPKLKNTKLSVTNQTRDGFTVNWEKANDETTKDNKINYEVYLGKEGAKPRLVYEEKGITSSTFTGLESGATYEVYVKAVDEAGNAVQYTSSKISLGDKMAPSAPRRTLQILRVTGDGFTVAWMKATDNFTEANKILYRLFVKEVTSQKKTQWQPVKEAEDISSCVLTGLKSGTRYDVYVLAIDEDGNEFRYPGDGDAVATVVTKDTEAPKTDNSLTAIVDTTSITLKWNPATDNATPANKILYEVFLLNGSSQTSVKKLVGKTSTTIEELLPYHKYSFTVKAYDEANNAHPYNTITVRTKDTEAPKTDNSLTATAEADSVTLKWVPAKDDGAEDWEILYIISQKVSDDWKELRQVFRDTTATISGLKPGVQYTFMVSARDAVGNTSSYNTVTVTTKDTEAPKTDNSLTATADANSVTLKWNPATDSVTPVDKIIYKVYQMFDSGQKVIWKRLIGETLAKIEDLEPGTKYSFIVKAWDEAGNSSTYNTVTVTTKDTEAPKTDNSLTATSDVNSVTLKWNPAKDNVTAANKIRYEIFQLVSSTWRIVEVVTGQTSYKVNGLGASTKFSFKVDAVDEADNRLSYNTVTVSTKDGVAPQTSNSLTATADTNSVTLKWAQATDDITAPGNIRYKVYRKVTGGRSLIMTVSGTSATVTGLSSGTQYIFEVDALDEADNARSYNQVTVTTKVAVTGVSLSSSSISLFCGQSKQLSATVSPSNANNKAVSWSTGNTSIASVSSSGLVKALNPGNTTVRVTTVDGSKTVSSSVKVSSLMFRPWAQKVNGDHYADLPSIIRPFGDNGRWDMTNNYLGLYLFKYDGATKSGVFIDSKYIQCRVSDSSVASFSQGSMYVSDSRGNGPAVNASALVFLLKKNGTTNVNIKITDPSNSSVVLYDKSFTIEVKNPAWERVAVTGVSLSTSRISLIRGQSFQLSAAVSPSNATNKAISWSTGNSSVATVSSGLVRAVDRGSTSIKVTTADGAKTAAATVTVSSLLFRAPRSKDLNGDHYDDVPSIIRPYGDNGKWLIIGGSLGIYLFQNNGSTKSGLLLDERYITCNISNLSVVSGSRGSMYVSVGNGPTANSSAIIFKLLRKGSSTITITIRDPKGSGTIVYQTSFTIIVDK